jgi:hypothetical protein
LSTSTPKSRFLSLALACLAATMLAAQTAPTPAGPFPAPVTGYAGRYLDSSATTDFQCCPRTYRAQVVKVAPERDAIYMMIGSTFVRQTLSTFVNRARTEAMVRLTGAGVVRGQGYPGEMYLPFAASLDPENPAEDWELLIADGQDRLFDFDWDDRGLTYVAYSIYGFGVVDANLDLVRQFPEPELTFSAKSLFSFRNGSNYYVVVSDGESAGRIYDVTNPSSPGSILPGPWFVNWAKTPGGAIALVTPDGKLAIRTAATFLTSPPILTLDHASGMAFRDVTTDGTRFYAIEGNLTSSATIHVLTPNGSTYADTTYPVAANDAMIEYGAGYLVLGKSFMSPVPRRAAIYTVSSGIPTLRGELPIDYFTTLNSPRTFVPVSVNGETVLIAGLNGVGDVFSLEKPPLTIEQQFAPAAVLAGGPSQLTITVTNANSAPVTSFHLSHTFPPELVNTASPASTTCGGSLGATTGTSSFVLTNGTLAASSGCTITLHLASSVAGSFASDIAGSAIVSVDNTNAAPSSATLTVVSGIPQSLSAAATSTSSVNLSWAAVSGATSYEVHRSTLNSAYAPVGTTSDTTYPDGGLVANRTYLYKVRAVVAGSTSAFSSADAATTTVFTDAAVSGIPAKTVHVNELRTAVNAMRAAAGLSASTFTDATLTPQSTRIKAAHITELRAALDAARAAIGLPALTYTDPSMAAGTATLKAAHVEELRAGTQ